MPHGHREMAKASMRFGPTMSIDGERTMPNVPDPINGRMKLYDFSHRSFQRPYSAKTVFFYKDGDEKFRGVRLPVSKSRYRTMESLLDDLNARVPLDFGVRRVFTPTGKREIQDPNHLEHLGMYVCSSTKWARQVNVDGMAERHSRQKVQSSDASQTKHRRVRSHNDSIMASSSAALNEKERLRRVVSTTTPPVSSLTSTKQILFILQSQPRRVYRVLLRPQKPQTFEQLLNEISQALQVAVFKIFTLDLRKMDSVERLLHSGESRFLALERHERPTGLPAPNAARFPPIAKRPAPRGGGGGGSVEREKSNTSTVDSLPPLPRRRPRPKATAAAAATDPKPAKSPRKTKKSRAEKTATPPPDTPTARAVVRIQAGARGYLARKRLQTEGAAAVRIQAGARGYLTRKRIRNRQKSRKSSKKKQHSEEAAPEVVEHSEVESATRLLQRAMRRWVQYRKSRELRIWLQSIGPREVVDPAATSIQAGYRGHRTRQSLRVQRMAKENIRSISPIRARRASIKIQSIFRGYRTRKQHERPRELYMCWTPVPPPPADFASQEMAATQIQSVFRGYKVRKELKGAPDATEKTAASPEKKRRKPRPEVPPPKTKKKKAKPQPPPAEGDYQYSVSVFTGNRWGADFDGDLQLVLHGQSGSSPPLTLPNSRQDPKFLQNQVDPFEVSCPYLGKLHSIHIGHAKKGYGSGIFLERVTVSETTAELRQYVFFASLWLDEGQADRKTQRTLPAAGFYNLATMPDGLLAEDGSQAQSLSKGRWEMEVLTKGASTGTLSVVAFGSFGHSSPIPLANLSAPIKMDFGEIGDLYKIRLEAGSEATEVEKVEAVCLRDLDTGEELELFCGKALGGQAQSFRELSVIRVGLEPLAQVTYSLKVRLRPGPAALSGQDWLELRLVGEYGDTGPVRIPTAAAKEGKELAVKLEAVALGRLLFVQAALPAEDQGMAVAEGFAALQAIFDKHKLGLLAGSAWLVESVRVRESPHAPYQFIFAESRHTETLTAGRVSKQLVLTEMEGLPTRAKGEAKTKTAGVGGTRFRVSVTTGSLDAAAPQPATPLLTLVGTRGNAGPAPLAASTSAAASKAKDSALFKPGATNTFLLSAKTPIGVLQKIRFSLDKGKATKASWYLKSVKVVDEATSDEAKFGLIESWVEGESVLEIPAAWPDLPPQSLVTYTIRVETGGESGNESGFCVSVGLRGDRGDTGLRPLVDAIGTTPAALFKPFNVDSFELTAVSVGSVKELELVVTASSKSTKADVRWLPARITVHDPQTDRVSEFLSDKDIVLKRNSSGREERKIKAS